MKHFTRLLFIIAAQKQSRFLGGLPLSMHEISLLPAFKDSPAY